jgi:membrane protease YdiL (CAAX protease family)
VGGAALSGGTWAADGAPAPWVFLFGTLAWTWSLIGLAALTGRSLADPVGALLLLAGGIGPVVVACLLIALGRWDRNLDAGPAAFLRRCFDPHTLAARHYLTVLGLIAVIALLPVLLDPSADWSTFAAGPAAFLLIGAVFGALEEPGWRGYAQEALQRRLPVLTASLVVGLFWALWHLPLFFVAGTYQASRRSRPSATAAASSAGPSCRCRPELGFDPVDVLFLGAEDALEQRAAAVVADLLAVGDGFPQQRQAFHLQLQVALEHFLDGLADVELTEILQVGQTLEKQDALHQFVGMLHLVDGLFALLLGQALEPPVLQHLGVQEVLVDGRELVLEHAVQVVDDGFVEGLHEGIPVERAARMPDRPSDSKRNYLIYK